MIDAGVEWVIGLVVMLVTVSGVLDERRKIGWSTRLINKFMMKGLLKV